MNRPAHILAAAALALGLSTDAEAEDVDATPPLELHDKQRDFIEDDSFIVCVLGGRQGGKSFVMAAKGCRKIVEKPKAYVLILGLTSEGCRDSVWPEIKLWAEELGIDEYVRDHEMRVGPLPNGSYLKCKGTDDRRAIENRRGAKPDLVMIDEMGSQDPAWIQYFVTSIVGPSMIKKRGQIVLGGTPGLVLTGYWYDLTNDERDPNGAPVYKWTAWDNPGLGTPEEVEEFVQKWLDAANLDRESVSYLREWKAEWREDKGSLVYPFDQRRNSFDEFPTSTKRGYPILDGWHYVVGVDVGIVDATAFVVAASNKYLPDTYIVHAEKHGGMTIGAFEAKLRHLKRVYPDAQIVIDSGGMGKVHANELTAWSSLAFEPAEKSEKPSAIRLFRDRLIAGRIKVRNTPELNPLRKEWGTLGWDKKRLQHDPDGEDHLSDAALYAERKLHHYRHDENKAKPRPKRGSVEELEEWERLNEQAEIAAARRTSRREAWDA